MTRIEFFFNVENKLEKVADLSEKAVKKGRRLMVFSSDANGSHEVAQALWQASPTGFVPNCLATSELAQHTPVVLAHTAENLVHDDVLVNLCDIQPSFFSRFTRLIEIVGVNEADKIKARQRYKFYRDRGYEIRSFDAQGAEI